MIILGATTLRHASVGSMKISLHGQSAVAVEAPQGRIVIDPGPLSDLSCLDNAGAVLLTHAHGDHLDIDAVRASGLPVWGTQEAIDAIGSGTAVHTGEEFEVLGLKIHAVGGLHEEIHPNIPRPENLGYFFNGVLHPGDMALFFCFYSRVEQGDHDEQADGKYDREDDEDISHPACLNTAARQCAHSAPVVVR